MLISSTPITLTGPARAPKQMLAGQTYDGHLSVHDDETAEKLGLPGAPIEGPTHFSQFDPMLASLWGSRWFERGTLSSHFLTMVVEGEEVTASVSIDGPGATTAKLYAEKADGTPVLEGTASIDGLGSIDGAESGTALATRLAKVQSSPPGDLYIIDQISVGQRGEEAETIRIGVDDHLGNLYPFSLRQKLDKITEPMRWYESGADDNPWGRPIIPIEMMSVITHSGSKRVGFKPASRRWDSSSISKSRWSPDRSSATTRTAPSARSWRSGRVGAPSRTGH
ncbi:MAG: hypothetical protein R2710_00345 [Acidimicrobiales bacterium]